MDKYILVTGASSGIGRAISIFLSSKGYLCILTGRNKIQLEVTRSKLTEFGHLTFSGDLNDEQFVSVISKQIPQIFGIVHAAGIIKLSPWKFVNRTDFDLIMKTNCFAPFFLTQALLKEKKIVNEGSIVFISSISGPIIGSKGNLMYSASKSAVNGMVKTLAIELASKKIRINAISAGVILTEMWAEENSSISKEQLEEDAKKYPLGYGKPSDVASLVEFLLSQDAAWITGTTMVADGGFSIQ